MTTPHRTRLILRGHQPLAQRDPNISRIYVASEDTHACEKYLLALQAAGLIDPARIEVLPLPTLDGHSTLAAVLQRLVDEGNSLVVIEHNLDVVKVADYIVDLGPEGGRGGGEIVATGTPEEVAKNKKSITGQFLKEELK